MLQIIDNKNETYTMLIIGLGVGMPMKAYQLRQ